MAKAPFVIQADTEVECPECGYVTPVHSFKVSNPTFKPVKGFVNGEFTCSHCQTVLLVTRTPIHR